jgi:NAD(P)-dependent dehydrogenase (short-subunit alcohol dehydrogenase family)
MTGANWNYQGKVALVTGATQGIGKAIARRLVESGAKVIAAARTRATLDTLAAEFDGSLVGVAADVCIAAELKRLVTEAVNRFGRLDVSFNVVGTTGGGSLTSLSEEGWNNAERVSLRSVFLGMKHQAEQMITQGDGGAIVNISSINSSVPLPGVIAYSTMKAGVDMLTRAAAVELADHRIRVNAVLPGLVATETNEALRSNPAMLDAFLERIPMRRPAAPLEMAGPALFLGSSEASYVTGSTLVVDGGWMQAGYPDIRKLLGRP